jgi:TonB family protein
MRGLLRHLGKLLALIAALSPTAAWAHCCCEHDGWHRVERSHAERFDAITDRACDNYPASALQAQASGVTWLQVRVDADGWVQAARIRHSSGRADLDRAAIACVTDWRLPGADGYDWRTVRVGWRFHWHSWS